MAQNIKFVRRGGIYCARRRVSEANRRAAAALRPEIPPAKPGAATNRADMESAPTEVCGIAGFAFSRLVTGLAPVRRGGIYPARGCLRRRGGCGTMRASSPAEVCYNAGARFPGWPLCFPLLRRAGVHARRTAANSKNMFRRPFFQRPPCGGVKPPPCRARQTLYRQETNAFLNRLTHP